MKQIFILSTIMVILSSFCLPKTENETWGFCTATNGSIIYVSSSFTCPIEDVQFGFPNTKVIRTWRLRLKEEFGDSYNESDFKYLTFEYKECNGGNISYRSRLEANEGRDCFIRQRKNKGQTVKTIFFVY